MLAAKNAKGAKKIAVLRWRCFNAEAQRRRVRRGDGRVEHVERVEGESVSQGAPSLRDGAMKSEYRHQ